MAITIANITINRIASRGTVTTRGDGAVARVLTLSGITSKAYNTLAQAKAIEVQLHELVWYSRQAGGLYVNSSEYDVDDGLYLLDSVTTGTDPATVSATYVVTVTLTLSRVGGGTANVSRTLYAQAFLAANDWLITGNLWYARPVGAAGLEVATGQKSRAGIDGAAFQIGTTTTHQYVLNSADHNAGECKVWETDGTTTMANWTRVYSPDHEFVSVDRCAFSNNWVRFVPHATSYGIHTLGIYDADDAIFRDLSYDTYTAGSLGSGTSWSRVLIETLTPFQVIISYWYARATAPFVVRKRYTLERGKLLALLEITTSTVAAGIVAGHFQIPSGATLRWLFGNDTTNDRNDAWDTVYDSGNLSISDTDDNWAAVLASDTDFDIMGVVAVRDNSYALVADATLNAVYSERTSTATHEVYIGGLPYLKTTAAGEAEAGSLTGTAAVTTIANASPATNNAVTLPALNDNVRMAAGNPPALDGASSITIKAYARIMNVGVSASDTVRFGIYNITGGSLAVSKDYTFAVLAATSTWKWVSIDTTWNSTDDMRPIVIRQVAGGGGSLYVDQFLFVTLSSSGGADGPAYLAHVALTEAVVWSVNSQVSV